MMVAIVSYHLDGLVDPEDGLDGRLHTAQCAALIDALPSGYSRLFSGLRRFNYLVWFNFNP
jgi:hypothetical protein